MKHIFLSQAGRFIVRPGKDEDRPYSMTVYAGKIFNLIIRLCGDGRYALGKYKVRHRLKSIFIYQYW